LQVIGLFLAFIGAFALSIDTLGKERTYGFIYRWFERFRRHRRNISWWIGIIIAFIAVLLINVWTTPLINAIVPPMFKLSVISICVSTIVALAIAQLAVGGRASFSQIGMAITTTTAVCYRVIVNPNQWGPLLERLQTQIISGFHLCMNPSRIGVMLRRAGRRIISVLPIANFYILLLGLAIVYLTTKNPLFWKSSIVIDLTFAITFILVMIGFLLGWIISIGLQFFIRGDSERTFFRLSVTGFMLLGTGFILQLIGVVIL
jgi:hypothetical protein